MVGASGAVSGTLGAYLLLHPRARIWTLVVFGFFVRVIPVPALIVLGFWVVLQLLHTVFTVARGDTGGVAFVAHVGGFIAGLMLLGVFQRPTVRRRHRRGL
jgi:membrane associated rhomboid family serine protease